MSLADSIVFKLDKGSYYCDRSEIELRIDEEGEFSMIYDGLHHSEVDEDEIYDWYWEDILDQFRYCLNNNDKERLDKFLIKNKNTINKSSIKYNTLKIFQRFWDHIKESRDKMEKEIDEILKVNPNATFTLSVCDSLLAINLICNGVKIPMNDLGLIEKGSRLFFVREKAKGRFYYSHFTQEKLYKNSSFVAQQLIAKSIMKVGKITDEMHRKNMEDKN